MTKKLKISEDLSLPVDIVTQKLAWLGVTGGGKTYAAQKLAELMWEIGAQFICLDPVGVWYGLRLASDGKRPSDITIPIFGGLHGDLPLEHTAGAFMADLIVDKGISAVLDVSQFESDAQKARFGADFADRFFFRKKAAPSAVHVFLEECQELIPQNPQKGEERMLHAFTRLQKLGRNFGIGTSAISQRPQEVNKKALNMAQTLFVFRVTGPQERKAIDGWVSEKGLDQDIAGDLPKLKTGTCHVWSPEFLGISEIVRIAEKRTFNASATPEVGEIAKARHLAPIDVDRIRMDMAATIERAKADDPKELRKEIAELKRAATKGTPATAPLSDRDRDRLKAEAKRETRAEWEPLLKEREVRINELERKLGRIGKSIEKAHDALEEIAKEFGRELPKLTAMPAAAIAPTPPVRVAVDVRRSVATPRASGNVTASEINPARQKILNGLAFLAGIGVPAADKTQLALIVGVSPTSGGYFNNLGGLRSTGLIEYPSGGTVALTDSGMAIASTDGVPTTTDELHDAIRAKLPAAKWKILEVAIAKYPRAISKDELAEKIGVSPTSGGYFNNLGSLRSLGLIDYPQAGHVVAQPVLFLEERR